MYLSIPTKEGQCNKDGIYEIWKYTIDDDGQVAGSEQITKDSPKNNARPYVIPGSKNSPMRLGWMQGDYYYWMVNKSYPLGYPTSLLCDYDWQEESTIDDSGKMLYCHCFGSGPSTLTLGFEMNAEKYEGTLFTILDDVDSSVNLRYSINAEDQRPELTIGGKTYKSQNRLLTSDNWANASSGTNGDNHPTKLTTWVLTLTYDGHVLTTYRNGFVDQVIEVEGFKGGTAEINADYVNDAQFPFNHRNLYIDAEYVCHSPVTIQRMMPDVQKEMQRRRNLSLPNELQNGDFEGAYTPMEGSGVASDRAVYVPEGWTVEYTSRNENDLSALKAGDYYFNNFFASRPKSAASSNQTYWVRQNWGTSTIALTQELLLPEGEYTLTAQIWKSGLGGDAYLQAVTQNGSTISAPTIENKEAWQQMTLDLQSDGIASTTIRLVAMHNNNGTEKIIGFDNVTLEKHVADAIRTPISPKVSTSLYDLQGRKVSGNTESGIFVAKGKKLIVK